MTITIVFANITMAMKAQNILRKNGFNGEIRKTAKTVAIGCTYSLKIKGDFEIIKGVLAENTIEYLQILDS